MNGSENETLLEPYHPVIVVSISIAMAALSVITVVGNAMVMLSFYLDKNIRQPANFYIFSLALSDFLIGLEGFPFYTIMTLQQEWRLGWFLCDLWLSVDYSVCLASIYTVLCITIDRYCSVKIPATYRNWRTPNKVLLIVGVVWTIPSLLFFTSVFGYGFFSGMLNTLGMFVGARQSNGCKGEGRILADNECYVQFMTNPYFNMGMYIGYYWTTLVVMIVLYAGIYRTAKGLQKKSEEKQKRLETMEQMRTTAQLVGSPVALHNAASTTASATTTRASRKGGSERKRTGGSKRAHPRKPGVTSSNASSSSIHSSDVDDTESSSRKNANDQRHPKAGNIGAKLLKECQATKPGIGLPGANLASAKTPRRPSNSPLNPSSRVTPASHPPSRHPPDMRTQLAAAARRSSSLERLKAAFLSRLRLGRNPSTRPPIPSSTSMPLASCLKKEAGDAARRNSGPSTSGPSEMQVLLEVPSSSKGREEESSTTAPVITPDPPSLLPVLVDVSLKPSIMQVLLEVPSSSKGREEESSTTAPVITPDPPSLLPVLVDVSLKPSIMQVYWKYHLHPKDEKRSPPQQPQLSPRTRPPFYPSLSMLASNHL